MANRCAHRKTPNKMFEQTCHTQFRPSEHPEKTSNNKKVLYFIRKNWFRLLLSTAVKMVGAYMACLIFKKVKNRKWHSSNCGMIIFWCTCRTILHSQSSSRHRRGNGYCHDDAKCHALQPKHETQALAYKLNRMHFHALVLNTLGAAQFEELVCSVALGYGDPGQIINRFITPDAPVEDFTVLLNND